MRFERKTQGMTEKGIAVVAFGGNALLPSTDHGTQDEQIARARQASRWLVEIVAKGYKLVIVHGNGPQVGNILIQAEEASIKVPPQTLDVAVAQTEGSIGFILQLALRNRLEFLELPAEVNTVLTEVEVDSADPAFRNPTKPVGPFFTSYRAEALSRDFGWVMKEDSGRGWRKVVPSPKPVRILNIRSLRVILRESTALIAAGGGGIPVAKARNGQWRGVEAVIDKDYSSALLATELEADLFIILTAVPQVSIRHGKPDEKRLAVMTLSEARKYHDEGEFPPGSMGPKIEAAIDFVERSRREVIITDIDNLREAIERKGGTRIVCD